MRKELLSLLQCSYCESNTFDLSIEEENLREIRKGDVTCVCCGRRFPIIEGILDVLLNPTEDIISEIAGWTCLGQAVEDKYTDEVMLALPDYLPGDCEGWRVLAGNFRYAISFIELSGQELVLDLGAGRCWASSFFALKGCTVVALDVLLPRCVGLLASDIYMEHHDIYFDRMRSDMNSMPFREESFDLVFVSSSLHHSTDLSRSLKEIARVLKPGGKLLATCEPVVPLWGSKELDCAEVKAGVNEHVYTLLEYLLAFRKARLTPDVLPYAGSINRPIAIADSIVRRSIFGRFLAPNRLWSPLLYAQMLFGGGPLNVIAYKIH